MKNSVKTILEGVEKSGQTLESIIAKIKTSDKGTFDSHDFIEAFAKAREADYVEMLSGYVADHPEKKKGIFRIINSQIVKYLDKNSARLGVEKINGEKGKSESVFGLSTDNQVWKKQ